MGGTILEFRHDFYEILQVDKKASLEVLTAAYQQLLSQKSPENGGDEESMHLIQKAYDVLSNPQDRFLYDSWLNEKGEIPIEYSSPNKTTENIFQPSQKLSVIDSYKFGIEMAIKQPELYFFIVMVSLLMSFISLPFITYYFNILDNSYILLMALSIIWPTIIGSVFSSIMIKIILNIFDGKEIRTNSLTSLGIIVNLILYSFLFMIILSLGFILLIIPGIIFMTKLFPGFALIIDEELNALDALKKSWKITKGFKWKIFIFGFAYILFSLLILIISGDELRNSTVSGIIGLIVGPIFLYAAAYFYRTLLQYTQSYDCGNIRANAFCYAIPGASPSIKVLVIIVIIGLLFLFINIYQPSMDNFDRQLASEYTNMHHLDSDHSHEMRS